MLKDCCVDLSHHNAIVDFPALKGAGVVGVILKATEGTTYIDKTFRRRREAARAAGLLTGAYHFARKGDGRVQADYLLSLDLDGADLLALDWEDGASGHMHPDEAARFVERIAEKTGRLPLLYSGNVAKEEFAAGRLPDVLAECPLWLCHYKTQNPKWAKAWKTWSLWQYTDKGRIAGVGGDCDLNIWNGDEAGLRRLWLGTPKVDGEPV